MASLDASDLAARLAGQAEAVCRHYLSNGTRQGGYWLVGDVRNTPGRSMCSCGSRGSRRVRGAAGKWTDAATGEHGDLLDVIRETCAPSRLQAGRRGSAALLEPPAPRARTRVAAPRTFAAPRGSPDAARRLSRWHSLSAVHSPRRICAHAALRLCTKPDRCASSPLLLPPR